MAAPGTPPAAGGAKTVFGMPAMALPRTAPAAPAPPPAAPAPAPAPAAPAPAADAYKATVLGLSAADDAALKSVIAAAAPVAAPAPEPQPAPAVVAPEPQPAPVAAHPDPTPAASSWSDAAPPVGWEDEPLKKPSQAAVAILIASLFVIVIGAGLAAYFLFVRPMQELQSMVNPYPAGLVVPQLPEGVPTVPNMPTIPTVPTAPPAPVPAPAPAPAP